MLAAFLAAGLGEIELARRASEHLLEGVTEEVRHALIHERGPVLEVHHPDPLVGGFHQFLIAGLLSAQGGFPAVALAQVAKGSDECDELAAGIGERRHRYANVHQRPVTAHEGGLDIPDFFAAPNVRQEGLQGLLASRSQKYRDVMADRLFRRVAEQGDCPWIPAPDDAVDAGHEDGVIGQFDDGSDQRIELVGAIRLGHLQRPLLDQPKTTKRLDRVTGP